MINKNESFRIDWVSKTLSKIPNNYRILDAGAGEQQYKKFCTHLNYISQDFAQYIPSEMENGFQMQEWNYGELDIICDITSIPEPDQSFDAILCTEVFEHISNPTDAIREFSRLIRKDGFLIITAPFCSMTHFAPYHFYSGFNIFFYEKHLAENGFEIIEKSTNGTYFEFIKQEINRIDLIAEKYTNRKSSFLEKKAMGVVNRMLNKFSLNDKGSNELLNFGFHILAKKK